MRICLKPGHTRSLTTPSLSHSPCGPGLGTKTLRPKHKCRRLLIAASAHRVAAGSAAGVRRAEEGQVGGPRGLGGGGGGRPGDSRPGGARGVEVGGPAAGKAWGRKQRDRKAGGVGPHPPHSPPTDFAGSPGAGVSVCSLNSEMSVLNKKPWARKNNIQKKCVG